MTSLVTCLLQKPNQNKTGLSSDIRDTKPKTFATLSHNPEGSQFCQSGRVLFLPIRRGPVFTNPEGSCFYQSGGVLFLPIRMGPNFANPEGSYFCQSGGVQFCQSGGVLFLSIRRGIVLSRLKKTTEKKVVKGVRLLGDRLGTSDCTGILPFTKKPSQNKTHWCGLKSKTFLRKVIALRILVGLARAVRRQIGNTGIGGCNRRPLEKITAFKFCLFGAAPSRDSSFFRNKFDYCIATD